MKQLRIKEAMIILTAAENNKDTFDAALHTYKMLCEKFNWENKGVLLIGGLDNIGDINEKEELREAYELGLSIK
jgi:hypothetical protein